jgi:hypothetical protein
MYGFELSEFNPPLSGCFVKTISPNGPAHLSGKMSEGQKLCVKCFVPLINVLCNFYLCSVNVDGVDVSSFKMDQIMQLFFGKNVIKLQFVPFTVPSSNSSSVGFQTFGSPSHFTSPHSLGAPVANFKAESSNERVMSIGAKSCAHCRCLLQLFNLRIYASFIYLTSCFVCRRHSKSPPRVSTAVAHTRLFTE